MEQSGKSRSTRAKRSPRKTKPSAPATDKAYRHTKEMILHGTYQGGELLSEGEVAQELGISRTPVREAFLRLESEGLLRLYPKKGALVVPVSVGEIEIVMETRRLIECYALSKLLDQGPNPELALFLESFVDKQNESLDRNEPQIFAEADRDFHARIVESTQNTILIDLYHGLRDRQIRMGFRSMINDSHRSKIIMDEHRQIADAILNGKENQALEIMNTHLNGTLFALRRL